MVYHKAEMRKETEVLNRKKQPDRQRERRHRVFDSPQCHPFMCGIWPSLIIHRLTVISSPVEFTAGGWGMWSTVTVAIIITEKSLTVLFPHWSWWGKFSTIRNAVSKHVRFMRRSLKVASGGCGTFVKSSGRCEYSCHNQMPFWRTWYPRFSVVAKEKWQNPSSNVITAAANTMEAIHPLKCVCLFACVCMCVCVCVCVCVCALIP